MTLACVIPDIANPFYPELVRGMQIVSDARGYDVIVINTGADCDRERRVLQWGLQGRVDGIVGVFFTLHSADFEPLTRVGIGVLRIEACDKAAGPLPIDNLFVDNAAAAAAAIRYLLERGHVRIAMITGTRGPQDHRMRGYHRTLLDAGLSHQVAVDAAFDEEGGFRATYAVLARAERPSAIFAANDLMAIGAIFALREAGLRVPEDVAVMGFDNIFAARIPTPALTTVDQFQDKLGQTAAAMILERLTQMPSGSPGRHHEMPFEIIKRQSA